MAATQKQELSKRDVILRAARKCFVLHGFHATGMAEICLAAGMSPGNLYRYFRNKAAIVQAIADETRARIVPVFKSLEAYEDPVEGIIGIIRHSVEEFCRGSESRLWLDVLAEAPRNEEMRKLCIAFDDQVRGCLKRLLGRVVESRKGLAGLDIEGTSMWLIALLDGAISRVSIYPRVDLERILSTLAGVIRRLLCPQPA